jgi:hypothetical protein
MKTTYYDEACNPQTWFETLDGRGVPTEIWLLRQEVNGMLWWYYRTQSATETASEKPAKNEAGNTD